MIPVYGFLQGDTLRLVIFADEDETMDALATKLQVAADVRVSSSVAGRVVFQGRVQDRKTTVAGAGMQALDTFEVTTEASS